MSRLGDLVARLALGRNPLLRGEVEELRLQMNQIQSTMSKVAEWAGATGNLSAPSLVGRSAHFDRHTHQPCVFDLRSSDGQALLWNSYVVAGAATAATLTTGAPAVDYICLVPLIVRRPLRVQGISFCVTAGGGAGSVARAGIYTNYKDLDFRPSVLVVDGGEKDTTTTGAKATTINVLLASDAVYWLAYLPGVSAPTIRTIPGSACAATGMTSDTSAIYRVGHDISFPYAALPASAGKSLATIDSNMTIPAIFLNVLSVEKDP